MKRLAVLVMAAVTLSATAAFSQAVAPATPAPSGILETISPILRELFYAVGSAVGIAIIAFIKAKWGIDLSAFRQSSFQIATANAAGLYRSTGDMSRAVDYLKESAPEAIAHFKIPDEKLPEKIDAKAAQLEAAVPVIPVTNSTLTSG